MYIYYIYIYIIMKVYSYLCVYTMVHGLCIVQALEDDVPSEMCRKCNVMFPLYDLR